MCGTSRMADNAQYPIQCSEVTFAMLVQGPQPEAGPVAHQPQAMTSVPLLQFSMLPPVSQTQSRPSPYMLPTRTSSNAS